MKFEDILYRKTLKYELEGGYPYLLKYKDDELEIWVFYDNGHVFHNPIECSPCLPFFIRLNGSEEYETCEPYELIEEEEGKIKYIGITKTTTLRGKPINLSDDDLPF